VTGFTKIIRKYVLKKAGKGCLHYPSLISKQFSMEGDSFHFREREEIKSSLRLELQYHSGSAMLGKAP
jgi:hypothetical protein